jgi:etoposide-induced 2.4 mRNA
VIVSAGIFDCLSFLKLIKVLWNNLETRKCIKQLLILNGLVYIGSLLLYTHAVEPLLLILLSIPIGSPQESFTRLPSWTFGVYFLAWIVPVYIFALVLNTIWYQKITDQVWSYIKSIRVTRSHASSPRAARSPLLDRVEALLRAWAVELYRLFIVLLLLGQAFLISILPLPSLSVMGFNVSLAELASQVLTTWVTAFYAFEYRWALLDVPLERRFAHIETNAAYFLGFGLIPTVATALATPAIGAGVFSIALPFAAVAALVAQPPGEKPAGAGSVRVPVFVLTRWASDRLLVGARDAWKSNFGATKGSGSGSGTPRAGSEGTATVASVSSEGEQG